MACDRTASWYQPHDCALALSGLIGCRRNAPWLDVRLASSRGPFPSPPCSSIGCPARDRLMNPRCAAAGSTDHGLQRTRLCRETGRVLATSAAGQRSNRSSSQASPQARGEAIHGLGRGAEQPRHISRHSLPAALRARRRARPARARRRARTYRDACAIGARSRSAARSLGWPRSRTSFHARAQNGCAALWRS